MTAVVDFTGGCWMVREEHGPTRPAVGRGSLVDKQNNAACTGTQFWR